MPTIAHPIYIPTWGRKRITTIEGMGTSLLSRIRLVVDKEWSQVLAEEYTTIKQVRCEVNTGAADAKQWILDYHKFSSLTIILDDDLRFQYSGETEGKKRFRNATPETIGKCFNKLEQKAIEPGVAFTSCSSTYFNNKFDEWGLCKQICGVFFINRETIKKSGATFGGIPTREDVYFSAQNWSQGFPSYSLMSFAAINSGDSSVGGESSIDPNTGEMKAGVIPRGQRTEMAHRKLAELFPDYITLVERPTGRSIAVGCTLDIKVRGVHMYKNALKGNS